MEVWIVTHSGAMRGGKIGDKEFKHNISQQKMRESRAYFWKVAGELLISLIFSYSESIAMVSLKKHKLNFVGL